MPDVVTGSTGVTSARPGQGLIGDLVDRELYAVWRLDGDRARSDQLPGVAVPARSFPGCIGVAPSAAFVAAQRHRARARRAGRRDRRRRAGRRGAPPHIRDGLHTLPSRANGDNMDTPQLVAGSRAYFEVQVRGGDAPIRGRPPLRAGRGRARRVRDRDEWHGAARDAAAPRRAAAGRDAAHRPPARVRRPVDHGDRARRAGRPSGRPRIGRPGRRPEPRGDRRRPHRLRRRSGVDPA